MKAVIYCRVSTKEQGDKGTSLDHQLSKCMAYATLQDLEVVSSFSEDFTGTTLKRPELGKALDLLRTGKAKVLVCYDSDRLSREPADYMLLRQELADSGLKLHYATQGEINLNDEMMQGLEDFRGRFNKQWLKKIVTEGTTNRRYKTSEGSYMGHGQAPYGYDAVKDGKVWKLVINEAEAQIVIDIFNWYVIDRLTIYQIVNRLNALGIETSHDKRNSPRTKAKKWEVYKVSRILSNEVYIGIWYYAKNSHKNKMMAAIEPIPVTDESIIPHIIDKAIWQRAQELKKQNRAGINRERPAELQALLRGSVTCGHCGYKMIVTSVKNRGKYYTYYTCNCSKISGQYRGECDNKHHFTVSKIDADIWRGIKDLYGDPQKLVQAIGQQSSKYDLEIAQLSQELARVDRAIQDRMTELERAASQFIKGGLLQAILEKQALELQEEITELTQRKDDITAKLNRQRLSQGQINTLLVMGKEVALGIERAEGNFSAMRKLVNDVLNVQVTLSYRDKKEDIQATCEVGDILPTVSHSYLTALLDTKPFRLVLNLFEHTVAQYPTSTHNSI